MKLRALKILLALLAGHSFVVLLLDGAVDQGFPFGMAVPAYLVFCVLSAPLVVLLGEPLGKEWKWK